MDFSHLSGGSRSRHCFYPPVSARHCCIYSFQMILFQVLSNFLILLLISIQLNSQDPLQFSKVPFSVKFSSLCNTQLSWLLQTLTSLSFIHWDHQVLSGCSLLALVLGLSSWGNHRTHLVSHFPRITILRYLPSIVLKIIVSHLLSFCGEFPYQMRL